MDSVQLNVVLNHLYATAVLIAAAIVGLGRLQRDTQDERLALVPRGHTAAPPSDPGSLPPRGTGGSLRRKQPRATV